MSRAKSTEQLNVRIPAFARDELRKLHAELESKDREDTSEPELVGALICAARRAATLKALERYRNRVRAGG